MSRAPLDRLLWVDLSAGEISSETIPEAWRRRFLGGKGIGARYLYDEVPPSADPLGPENALLFMVGPLSGRLPGEQRYAAITKSPLTGGFLDSYSGGTFANRLVQSLGRHMGIAITGEAPEPVAIVLESGAATIEPVPELEGKDVIDTCDTYPESGVACIGPAGENEVHYATIGTERGQHQAGRGGAGAVMGSKNCKAIVVREDPKPLDPELKATYEERFLQSDTGRWQSASGTVETIDFADTVGVLPSKGWQEGGVADAESLGIDAVSEAATERENEDEEVKGGFRIEVDSEDFVPRGATAMSLGAGLGVEDFDAVATLGQTCDRLGLDVITAGNVAAWAVLASQQGYIDREIEFGDTAALQNLIEDVTTRSDPVVDALASGIEAAATEFGGENLLPTVKSMDPPPYDPRGSISMSLAYATSDRGACHRRAMPVEEEVFTRDDLSVAERVQMVIEEQNRNSLLWCLIADSFAGESLRPEGVKDLLDVVGLEYTVEELQLVGERVWTLTRLFNVREGFDQEHDELPSVFTEPMEGGATDGRYIDTEQFDTLLQQYYAERGWDEQGRPTAEKLIDLDLWPMVDEMTPVGETTSPDDARSRS